MIEPRGHRTQVASVSVGLDDLILQKSEFSIDARNLRTHQPVIQRRQESQDRVEHTQNGNEQNDQLAEQVRRPERKIVVQVWPAGLVELQRLAAQRDVDGFGGGELVGLVKNALP